MKPSIIAWAAMAALTGAPAAAGTIVQNQGATLLDVGNSFGVPLPFNRFNPALGTLDSVTLDGTLDFAGASGATDTVVGLPLTGSAAAPPPVSALPEFIGAGQIFLTLTATSFPIVSGMETETVEETADAHTTAVLTYRFTPLAVAEPAGWTILAAGLFGLGLLGVWQRKNFP